MIHDSRYRFVKAVGMVDKIGKYTCFIYVRVNFCPIINLRMFPRLFLNHTQKIRCFPTTRHDSFEHPGSKPKRSWCDRAETFSGAGVWAVVNVPPD